MESTLNSLGSAQTTTGSVEKVVLFSRQIYRIKHHSTAVQIQGMKGTVYVTAPDDPEDHIVRPGEKLVVHSRGMVLVQGMPDGTFSFSSI